ncbi:unnamed protein product [Effrenium voratum]|nr:unnamed protein product [Effrenium voratum]
MPQDAAFDLYDERWRDCWIAATSTARLRKKQVDMDIQNRVQRLIETHGPNTEKPLTLRVYGTMIKGFCVINNERARSLYYDSERVVLMFARQPFTEDSKIRLPAAKRQRMEAALTLDLDVSKAEAFDWTQAPLEEGALLQLGEVPMELELPAPQLLDPSCEAKDWLPRFPELGPPEPQPQVPPPEAPEAPQAREAEVTLLEPVPSQLVPVEVPLEARDPAPGAPGDLEAAIQASKRRKERAAPLLQPGMVYGFDCNPLVSAQEFEEWQAGEALNRPRLQAATYAEAMEEDFQAADHLGCSLRLLVDPDSTLYMEHGAGVRLTELPQMQSLLSAPAPDLGAEPAKLHEAVEESLVIDALMRNEDHEAFAGEGPAFGNEAQDDHTAELGENICRRLRSEGTVTLDMIVPPGQATRATAALTFAAVLALATAGSYRQEPGMPIGERRSSSSYSGDPRYGRIQKNRKGLLGLCNLGNTCFMNAALQCLTHTHGLQKYFRHCPHAYSLKAQGSRQKLLMAFAHWFEQDWGKNVSAPYHQPEDVLRAVQQLNPTFQGYSQQDSQEFLRCVLDNIHEELRREVRDEADGRGLSGENGASSEAGRAQPERSSGTPASSTDFLASGEVLPRSSSAAQQLMQFCQGPESNTDMGEIRLTAGSAENRPASESTDMESSSSCCGPSPNMASGESSEGGAESSSKKDVQTRFESIVSELFQGKVVSCVRCLQCNQISRTSEAVYDISVPIPNANEPASPMSGADSSPVSMPSSPGALQRSASGGLRSSSWSGVLGGLGKVKSWFYDKGVSLSDCLRRYCAPEYLTGKDQYFCERCKRKNDCEKRIVFKDLPEVLCIHLKRFRFDNAYGWFAGAKNSRVVTFPVTSTLDMSPFMEEAPNQSEAQNTLIGLIQHIGSMGGGHYIAYCQHKKRDKDWYEFDDIQVNPVSAEQVERAEPYVLFYQRVPSRAAKRDRQTFKSDMRRMQEQINGYLLACSSRPEPGRLVQEEIRNHGPTVRNLFRCPPKELDMAFVSKHWYVRLTTMSHPGPIDNQEYLCPHGQLGYSSAEMASEPFFPISKSLSQALIGVYGGGPEISALEICPKCQAYINAYNARKQAEFDLVSRYDTKDTGDGDGWYLVSAVWVNDWKRYVKGEPATNIQDMCAPGPITNERLFDKEDPQKLRPNLKLKLDYIGVNACVWWLFMHIHGGGPAVVRDDLEIYSKELRPEVHLVPQELRPAEGDDFAMRTSRQFVDECHGDFELYNSLHGSNSKEKGDASQEALISGVEDAPEDVPQENVSREVPRAPRDQGNEEDPAGEDVPSERPVDSGEVAPEAPPGQPEAPAPSDSQPQTDAATTEYAPDRRRVVIQRKARIREKRTRPKEQMEHLGLDPSDPAPALPDEEFPPEAEMPPPAAAFTANLRPSPSQVSQPAQKAKQRKTVSLKTRTLEEQIVAGRYDRALDRWGQQQQDWEKFRHLAAQKTGRDKAELVVTRAEEHRERLEVMELLERATPEEIKSGGFNWYHSLRGEGTRFVQVGNMFSGLYLPLKLHKENYVHEIIRKPLMVDLTTARHAAEASGKRRPRSWRDDEYLLARIRKYGARMKEMAPGLLEYDEILEPEVQALRAAEAEGGGGNPEEELMAALMEEGGGAVDNTLLHAEDQCDAATVPLEEGPHVEVMPPCLHFQADVKKMCTRTIRLRNSGTAVLQFEWVQNTPRQNYQDSVLPGDETQHFTCHQTTGRVLPGDEAHMMFSFTAPTPGNFTSSWCLKTYPELQEPVTELAMNGSATVGDLHWERRAALQEYMRKEQTLSLASEIAEDIVEAVRLQPPQLPDLSQEPVQERLFEEVNAAEGLFWSPLTWEAFTGLRDKVEQLMPPPATSEEGRAPSFLVRAGARGRRPVAKVDPPSAAEPLQLDSLQVPSLKRMRTQLEKLPGTEPGADQPSEKVEVSRQLEQAVRSARKRPMERSPLWWLAYETVMEIVSVLPDKWTATRQRNGLEPLPFLPPPDEEASPEQHEEYNLQLEERKAKLAPEEKEAEVRDIFCRGFMKNKFGPACARFGAVAKEAMLTTRMTRAGSLSLGERLRPYLGRLSAEAVELAGQVVLYELDVGFMLPPAPTAADGEEPRVQLQLEGSEELLKQRLRGVVSVLESAPLAVLVMVHLGEPAPDKPREEGELMELQVQARMASLASTEPILEVLREVVGTAATMVEFAPHDAWLGNADFAQKVRNEEVENKVFLLENLSAIAEETGIRRHLQPPPEGQEAEPEVALTSLPWAAREGWAARAVRDLQPESMVQDALEQSCHSMTFNTGLWPKVPQRVVGPAIEAELAAFLDVLQLPIRATPAEEEAARLEMEQSVAEDGKAPPAPLLVVLGGGGFSSEEVLLKKLELLIGLSRLAPYEKGGLQIMAAGELACCLLSGVLGISMGGPARDWAKGALQEALLDVLRTGVSLSLPLDLLCKVPEGDAESQDREVVPLAAAWKVSQPIFLGFCDGRECYVSLDPEHGTLQLSQSASSPEEGPEAPEALEAEPAEPAEPEEPAEPADPEDPEAAADVAEPEAAEEAAKTFPAGVPENWTPKDIGPATLEQLRMLLRRSRGAVWNGSLGCCEDGFQEGTKDFLAMLDSRLTGAGEDGCSCARCLWQAVVSLAGS